ncbi:MAG: YkgJ family cysteine cluster protein [Sulfuriferula sp.]
MSFPCTKCGLCCRHVDRSELTQALDDGDGVCMHLDRKADICTIYDSRPDLCRIDSAFQFFEQEMTLTEYYLANARVCNALQIEHKTDLSKMVVILGV